MYSANGLFCKKNTLTAASSMRRESEPVVSRLARPRAQLMLRESQVSSSAEGSAVRDVPSPSFGVGSGCGSRHFNSSVPKSLPSTPYMWLKSFVGTQDPAHPRDGTKEGYRGGEKGVEGLSSDSGSQWRRVDSSPNHARLHI
jgi:hypothetical protein